MRKTLVICRRELAGGLFRPAGFFVLFCFLLVIGAGCLAHLYAGARTLTAVELRNLVFGDSVLSQGAILLLVPLLTMRTLAAERESGTLEMLMSAPVSDAAVVGGKFLGAWGLFALLWLPVAGQIALVDHMRPALALPWQSLAAAYLALMVPVGAAVALGVLASALSPTPTASALLTFALLSVLGSLSYAAGLLLDGEGHMSLFFLDHIREFRNGILDGRALVLYATVTVWALFAATRVLETRKWL